MIYHTQAEHATHYTIEEVSKFIIFGPNICVAYRQIKFQDLFPYE